MSNTSDFASGTENGGPTQENAPSLENPTREYLLSHFKKTELQKRCLELGITKVWVTKEMLVEMIMEKHRSVSVSGSDRQLHENESGNLIQKILSDIDDLKERLLIKDTQIEDLNDMLKNAYVTINKLSDRVTVLEEQVRQGGQEHSQSTTGSTTPQQGNSTNPSVREGTLLLGDTNLTFVRSADLGENCSIRTITDANVDLLKCWVAEKLNWIPTRCILYCGMQDILDDVTANVILDNVGMLISNLKQLYENIEISICQLVPTLREDGLKDKINTYNNQLMEWSSNNGVSVIKTDPSFRLGTGDVDEMCYDVDGDLSGILLNRLGTIRLLTTIKNQCPYFSLCDNWNTMKRNYDKILTNNDRNNITSKNFVSRVENVQPNRINQNWPRYHRNAQVQYRSRTYEQRDYHGRHRFEDKRNEWPSLPNSTRQRNNDRVRQHSYSSYESRIKCFSCQRYGHKSYVCPQNA